MLSATQLAEILERLNSGETDGICPGNEKRRAPRMAIKNRATIVPCTDGIESEPVGVEVRDFSARGLRFLHSRRMEQGSQFVLELAQQNADPVQILCTVMHCRPTKEGPLSIGAEFTCALRTAPARLPTSERDRISQSILD